MNADLIHSPESLSFHTIAMVAMAHFIFGAMGLSLAIPPGYASPIFSAADIALALMLWAGNLAWPGTLMLTVLNWA